MADLVNRVQLPTKCSKCGNKLFRVQYTEFGDRHIHSLDYCQECDKELNYKLMREIDSGRAAAGRNRVLTTALLILGIAAIIIVILREIGILKIA